MPPTLTLPRARERELYGEPRDFIIRCTLIRDCLATFSALMNEDPTLGALVVEADWVHHSFAVRSSVARAHFIHVLRMQAKRAVVAVAALGKGGDILSTMFANKGFLSSNKYHKDSEESEDSGESEEYSSSESSASSASSESSYVKPKMHHISIFHDICLSFLS